jgi:hypothetical protein
VAQIETINPLRGSDTAAKQPSTELLQGCAILYSTLAFLPSERSLHHTCTTTFWANSIKPVQVQLFPFTWKHTPHGCRRNSSRGGDGRANHAVFAVQAHCLQEDYCRREALMRAAVLRPSITTKAEEKLCVRSFTTALRECDGPTECLKLCTEL